MSARSLSGAVKLYMNGRRAQQLDGFADLAGKVLSAYDSAMTRSVSGLVLPTLHEVFSIEPWTADASALGPLDVL